MGFGVGYGIRPVYLLLSFKLSLFIARFEYSNLSLPDIPRGGKNMSHPPSSPNFYRRIGFRPPEGELTHAPLQVFADSELPNSAMDLAVSDGHWESAGSTVSTEQAEEVVGSNNVSTFYKGEGIFCYQTVLKRPRLFYSCSSLGTGNQPIRGFGDEKSSYQMVPSPSRSLSFLYSGSANQLIKGNRDHTIFSYQMVSSPLSSCGSQCNNYHEAQLLLAMDPLPDDIFVKNILELLPTKILARLRTVSKAWLFLVDEAIYQRSKKSFLLTRHFDFVNPYIETCRKSHLKFSTYNLETFDRISKFFWTTSQWSQFPPCVPVQSCEGIICVGFDTEGIVLLCNPVTAEMLVLPLTDGNEILLGLGYAESIKRYKVVRFFGTDYMQHSCDIFTLGPGQRSWRTARSLPPFLPAHGRAPYLHGAIHLLRPDRHVKQDGGRDKDYIACFDVDTELYRDPIHMPDAYHLAQFQYRRSGTTIRNLTVLDGSISMCHTVGYASTEGRIDIWILKDYAKASWVKQFTLSLTKLAVNLRNGFTVDIIAVLGERRVLLNICQSSGFCLVYYDPVNDTIIKLEKECSAVVYKESLFSLKGALVPACHSGIGRGMN